MNNDNVTDLELGLAILITVFLAYLPVLNAGFIWDDDIFLTNNPLIHAENGLKRIWFSTEAPDYFPLTSTTLWVEWRLWGMNATGYHITNVVLHCSSTLLIWFILKELNIPGAWAAALIFGIHPVNVESVAWITERKNTLPMLFYTTSILLFLRAESSQSKKLYTLSLFSHLLALLGKTSVVTQPFVLLLTLWWKKRQIGKKELIKITPFLLLSIVLGFITLWFQYNRAIDTEVVRSDGLLSRLAVAGMAVWFYIYKALIPLNLSFVYPKWSVDTGALVTYLPVITLVLIFTLLIYKKESLARAPLFGLGYFLITLLPVLGFLDIYFMKYSLVTDHWQYFSIMGVITLMVSTFAYYLRNKSRSYDKVSLLLLLLIFIICFTLTYMQCRIYRNTEVLWTDTVKKNPQSGLAYNNLGRIYELKGQFQAAISHYEKALALMPEDCVIPYNMGSVLSRLKDYKKAKEYYKLSIGNNPEFALPYNNLGYIYLESGQYDRAEANFQKALSLKADYFEPIMNMAIINTFRKEYDKAIALYKRALILNPQNADLLHNYANTLFEAGKPEEASEYMKKAKQLSLQSIKNKDLELWDQVF